MPTQPWYETTYRWAQTNLVEIDPSRYDDAWWRAHWRSTKVQGVIVNAGGIVAYYPSEYPLHHRAVTLGDRDLYGEVVASAREEGLKVIARMDSNRVANDFYRAHPDWICVDIKGKPYMQAEKYVTCINSPYYSEYLPMIMQEIIARSSPDGFSDNSWTGLPRTSICYCKHCSAAFFDFASVELPTSHDWADERFRLWIQWSYRRRTEIWELNNRVTTEAGGKDCHWMGMISGDVLNNSNRFIDLREILARTAIIMLDHQRRNRVDGFEQNTEAGKRLHELAGPQMLIPESTPQYQLGAPAFRLASMPPAEVRLWSSAAFAGGIQPWWHHIGSCHDDRRQYKTAAPIFTWHEANQDILIDRQAVADVGIVWSQANHDYHGQSQADERTLNPYRGAVKAMDRAGLTWLPVHAEDITAAQGRFRVLILPNLAAMSDEQIAAVLAFQAAGGGVVATSQSGLFDAHGDPREHSALSDLFGIRSLGGEIGGQGMPDANIETHARHSYLRLAPELRDGVYGPKDPAAPVATGTRHPVLSGLDETDSLPFGGYLPRIAVAGDAEVLATFIPDFPIFPPETSWMRQPKTDIPAIVVRQPASGGRLAFFAADLDRCFARDEQFEHGLLLANAVRWMLDGEPATSVEGSYGLVTPTLYAQVGRQILHLNNRLITARVPGRQDQLVPIGPVTVRLRIDPGTTPPDKVALRVAGSTVGARVDGAALVVEVPQVFDHEVIVIDWGTGGR
ncbi:MAG: alpha-amylase family protein [Cypionkella sp.]